MLQWAFLFEAHYCNRLEEELLHTSVVHIKHGNAILSEDYVRIPHIILCAQCFTFNHYYNSFELCTYRSCVCFNT